MKTIKFAISSCLIGAVVVGLGLTLSDASAKRTSSSTNDDELGLGFSMEELEAQRAESNRSYLPFLDRSTLSCGVYFLAAGADDGQSPHSQDEIYYVRSGKGKLNVEGEDFDAVPGEVLFVAANAKHHFHSIEEDLTLLVFFSKKEVE